MITTGIIASIAADHPHVVWGILGFILSYLCLAWEKRTAQWRAVLFEQLKSLEELAIDEGKMIEAYSKYPSKPPNWLFVRATWAVQGIYIVAMFSWCVFIVVLN